MTQRGLPPEAAVDLQIHLDRLRDLEDRCRAALRQISAGELTRDEYLGLVESQIEAHEAWRSRHARYFGA